MMKGKIDGTKEERKLYWDNFFGVYPDDETTDDETVVKPTTEKLFVYGIFLGEANRKAYGMTNPQYATVPGYLTVGHHIVQAMKVDNPNIALTGLLVDMDATRWKPLDALEGGYDRARVKTDGGIEAWMYVQPERKKW